MLLAAITIDLDPTLRIGPLNIAWHGLMTAVGLGVGAAVARRYADARGLVRDELLTTIVIATLAGIVGARLLYLLEVGTLAPTDWLGTRGFSIYGGLIGGGLAASIYLWRRQLGPGYLDAMAAGFPLGLTVGRIGDLISGEHHGGISDVPWAVRYLHPAAEVPQVGIAYQSGALYEIVLGLAIAALVLRLQRVLTRPLALLWLVIGSYGAGRFVMFFFRDDSGSTALGLSVSQVISLVLVATACAGWAWARHRWPGGRRLILTNR